MKIIVLAENTVCREELGCEHGLSLYIEAAGKRILFDMGQSALFADNAAKLGVDLTQVDLAVLSHGHYDHGGGMRVFLEINRKAPVYVTRSAFALHFNAEGKYIGLAPETSERLIYVGDSFEVAPGITLHTCNHRERIAPVDAFGLTTGENRMPDDFRHEQYLLIEEAGKKFCISGCSHKGIRNIVHWFHPDVLIGGFHFMKIGDRERLIEEAEHLRQCPAVYYTGHCTGEAQYEILKTAMGEQLYHFSTGTVLEW